MTRIAVFREFFSLSWREHRLFAFVSILKNGLTALVPLINIAGIGMVLDALTTGGDVVSVVLGFVSLSLGASLAGQIFSYFEIVLERKASDAVQFDYMRDGVTVNYHFAQDCSILEMKKKTMGANPVFSFRYIGNLIDHMVRFAGIVYLFSRLAPWFLLIIFVTSAVSVKPVFMGRKAEFDYENLQIENTRKQDYLYDLMTRYEYAKEVRVNGLSGMIFSKFSQNLSTRMHTLLAYMKRRSKLDVLSALIAVIQSVAMYLYFSYSVFTRQLTIAEYTVLLGAVTLLTSILIDFFDNAARIWRMVARMDLYLDYKKTVREYSDSWLTNELPEAEIPPGAKLRFENVSFCYPGAANPALEKLSFTICDGQNIGLVGLNGSGKTTMVKLILRLYQPTEGRILLNGTDINTIPLGQYLKLVGAVLQDFVIFAYSVKENIVFDGEADGQRLSDAIGKSGFAKRLSRLPEGVETPLYKELSADGVELSGGEGQKLALARALYRDARFLILDEPTSTLDPVAEYEMFANLRELAEGKTTIFISHRLSSTRFCDRIFVIEDGRMIENGTHADLLAGGGKYAGMFEAQAKLYRGNGNASEQ